VCDDPQKYRVFDCRNMALDGRGMFAAGTHFTRFTSTKAQILTAEEVQSRGIAVPYMMRLRVRSPPPPYFFFFFSLSCVSTASLCAPLVRMSGFGNFEARSVYGAQGEEREVVVGREGGRAVNVSQVGVYGAGRGARSLYAESQQVDVIRKRLQVLKTTVAGISICTFVPVKQVS
jgi:hypothetical protein